MRIFLSIFPLLAVLASGCPASKPSTVSNPDNQNTVNTIQPSNTSDGQATAAFAAGCFWCVEEVFESLVGVDSVISGYAGGHAPNPTYELVNTETTGHAESVLVYFRPDLISYQELIRVFYGSHDPTTPNRQGPDAGPSYRSILFYQNPDEKRLAEEITKLTSKEYTKPIVTEMKKLEVFYRAEEYHQNYVVHNPENPYVQRVSKPRFEKWKASYSGKLKGAH